MRSNRFLVGLFALVIFATSVAYGDITPWIVGNISQDSYTHYLDDMLYTHDGDNRGIGGAEHDLARDFIHSEFESFGFDTSLHPFQYSGSTYHNVVGVHLGTVRPDDIYILGAHYDSVNNPGADDNASGVAGMLETARVLSRHEWEATMIFIGFDREEQGLIGSWAWANDHSNMNILGMVALDMIAYDPDGDDWARLYSTDASAPVRDALQSSLATYGGIDAHDVGSIDRSDHWPFEALGFDACLLIEYDVFGNPHYHRASDSVDTPNYIDYEFATNMTRGAAGWLAGEATIAPEPGTLVLIVIGVPVLGWVRRRRVA